MLRPGAMLLPKTAGPVQGDGAVACSGPGAWAAMRDADVYGYWSAFFVVLLLVPTLALLIRSGHPLLAGAHLFLLALHPSWTVSAWHGDCGMLKESASTVFVVVAGLGLVEAAVVATFFNRPWPSPWRKPGRGFCPACGYDLRGSPERCPECGAAAA